MRDVRGRIIGHGSVVHDRIGEAEKKEKSGSRGCTGKSEAELAVNPRAPVEEVCTLRDTASGADLCVGGRRRALDAVAL